MLLPMFFALLRAVLATPITSSPSPTITLDYTTIIPALGNTTLGFYKYQNIRFAAPPTGSLRWSKPQWPSHETSINNGTLASIDVTCSAVEDCLFMDVWVPTAPSKPGPFPVMVWQYGGGFTFGSKTQAATQTTPEGFFNLTSDFIFVAFNYRLGITGLATGPTFNHGGGTSNVGLRDTEHGFRWVKKYIHAFGGDPDQVTAVGHSAGASAILFQMTRFAGRSEQLFSRAYVQSPGYWAGAGHWSAEQFWKNVSTAVGCAHGNLSCMRDISFEVLSQATANVTATSGYILQPKVDGHFVADTYEAQFYQKNFNFSGPLVITHELHEENGTPYHGINNTQDIISYLGRVFPSMTTQAIDEMFSLYPESSYSSTGLRFADIAQSIELTARDLAVTNALGNNTWNAENVIPPAIHVADQSYYWYSPLKIPTTSVPSPFPPTPVDIPTAVLMQKYLLSFVIMGDPNSMWKDDTRKIFWPKYGSNGTTILFNTTQFSLSGDDLANERSLFWNKALWY